MNRFFVMVGCLALVGSVYAQLSGSVIVEPSAPLIHPETGIPLRGTPSWAVDLGYTFEQGCLVQLLRSTNGLAEPPSSDGSPASGQSVITERFIGQGVAPDPERRGCFSLVFSDPPSGDLLVRVFDAPNRLMASRIAQSELFTLPADGLVSVDMMWHATPLAADTDGDGLHDPGELELGTDPLRRDTDGDDLADGDELRAGTDPLDDTSLIELVGVRRDADEILVIWTGGTGRFYQVEATVDPLAGEPGYVARGSLVTATQSVMSRTVGTVPSSTSITYRVRLVD